jgi:hypothetical protein
LGFLSDLEINSASSEFHSWHGQCRPEAGLLKEFIALGLQHEPRAGCSLEGVRSTLCAGGHNAANSRRSVAQRRSVNGGGLRIRPFLPLVGKNEHVDVIECFRTLTEETSIPRQNLINPCLRECIQTDSWLARSLALPIVLWSQQGCSLTA